MPRPPSKEKSNDPGAIAEKLLAELNSDQLLVTMRAILAARPELREEVNVVSEPVADLEQSSFPEDEVKQVSPCSAHNVASAQCSILDHAEDTSIVQFSSSIFYCSEDEGVVVVDILRLGCKQRPCSVKFETVDASAKAGIKYRATSGVLTFQPGETTKSVEVHLINNRRWDATLEFLVQLSNEQDTALGRYLYTCRVRIADTDPFPSKRFEALIRKQQFADIPKIQLLIEYFKMNLLYDGMLRKVLTVAIFSLLDCAVTIVEMIIKIRVVDVLLRQSSDEEALQNQVLQLNLISAFTFLAAIARFSLSRLTIGTRLAGQCRQILQTNIVRKYLNYEYHVRAGVHESDIIMALTRDCPNLVRDGFLSLITLFKQFSLLAMLLGFQIWNSYRAAGGSQIDFAVYVLPSICFPICVPVYLRVRHTKTGKANLRVDVAVNLLSRLAERCVHNVELIIGFQSRPQTIAGIDAQVQELNQATTRADAIHVTNLSFGPLLAALTFVLYCVYAGPKCINGSLTIGHAITHIDALRLSALAWNQVYLECLVVQRSYPAFDHIVRYMNMPVDLPRRMLLHHRNRKAGEDARKIARQSLHAAPLDDANFSYAIDMIPLKLSDVEFSYEADKVDYVHNSLQAASRHSKDDLTRTQLLAIGTNLTKETARLGRASLDLALTGTFRLSGLFPAVHETDKLEDGQDMVFGPWSLDLEQGKLHALVGLHGQGKSTLLKILASVLLPSEGTCFIPPHLRTFFVSKTPLFFMGNLFENLVFGANSADDGDLGIERILAICGRLRVPPHVVALIDTREVHVRAQLSTSEKMQLHLARALIANPEILVLEHPTAYFSDDQARITMDALCMHVRDRGLEIDRHGSNLAYKRRPRTVIFTTSRLLCAQSADLIHLTRRDSITQLAAADVKKSMIE